jgi:hypothetical protein
LSNGECRSAAIGDAVATPASLLSWQERHASFPLYRHGVEPPECCEMLSQDS